MIRNLFYSLREHLVKKEFTIITGARQTGKSTLLHELEKYCKKKDIPTIFLNLENSSILKALDESPLNIFYYLPITEKRNVIFIDEIQYLNNPSNFLKLLYDDYAPKIKIVASGSSAFYMDKSFKDSLAGRKRIFHLPTCDFEEYLNLSSKLDLLQEITRIRENKNAKSLKIIQLEQEYKQFLIYGGYPAVITEKKLTEKKELLAEIRDSFVKKDILESDIRNEKEFYNLFRILASQSGNLLNINNLSNTLDIKNETIKKYLLVLQKCFHIALVSPFHRNLQKELIKMPKVYLLDSGLMNSLLNNFQPISERINKGEIWETACYKMLSEKYKQDEIYFWRTISGNEVDFVLPNIENPFAAEIKFDKNAIKENKYKKFSENYIDIPLKYIYFQPFTEDFFRMLLCSGKNIG